ncbi:MAG TPA: hypothetical protein VHM70_14720 [Polyangiaceae bacterium]|jgi:hypothetical protein|nr:hypothetical protein [Polyangiaceae bacterium]
MMRYVAIGFVGAMAMACGAEAPVAGEEFTESDVDTNQEPLSITPSVTSLPTVEYAPSGTGLVLGDDPSGDNALLGKNKCTYDKQLQCDQCISGCDGICAQPDGGGRAGGCVGLFCPTRCDVCQLSCYTTCGKCIPTIYK